MLSDAQIERWSRQILVPEVGGRGQERLCAARVELLGDHALLGAAAELIERAGPAVARVERAGEAADVVVALGPRPSAGWRGARRAVVGLVHGAGAVLTAVAATPCPACVVSPEPLPAPGAPAAITTAATRITAALAAAEVVRLLVVAGAEGRTHRFDLGAGTFTSKPALAGGSCDVCGGRA